jgi:hypothetical protein
MHERPLLFVGSSTNGLEVATTLKQLLTEANDPPLEIELWREALLAAKRKLHYSFNGKHYPTAGHDQAEEYRGFTTYEFDPPPTPLEFLSKSGKGELSDRNVRPDLG